MILTTSTESRHTKQGVVRLQLSRAKRQQKHGTFSIRSLSVMGGVNNIPKARAKETAHPAAESAIAFNSRGNWPMASSSYRRHSADGL
jgi:hypothetical protein